MIIECVALLETLEGPHIELPTDIGLIDLHNFADFFELNCRSDGTLRLVWKSHQSGKFIVGSKVIEQAELLFQDVQRFSATARDQKMPRSEDRTLEHFLITEGESVVNISFLFCGGSQYDIGAQSLQVILTVEEVEK